VAFLECGMNMSTVLRLENDLDVDALRRSLGEIVRRHAVLRSTFHEADGRVVAVTQPAAPISLPTIDLRPMPDSEQEPHLQRLLVKEVDAPFDLATGPLLRACLVVLRDRVHVLAITVHHLVFDGGSSTVLMRELSALYGAYASGQPSPLPEPSATYADYVAWQRERLQGDTLRRLMDAWMARVGTAPPLRLPGDDVADMPAGAFRVVRFTLGSDRVEALRSLCRRQAVTPAIATLALFAMFLHAVTGAIDLLVGVPVADRRRRAFEDLIGLFTNVLVVRIDLSGNPSAVDMLTRVRRAMEQAYAEQDLPYGYFVRTRAAAEGSAPAAPYRVAYNFMSVTSDGAIDLPGLDVRPLPIVNQPPALADLGLQVRGKRDVLSCSLLVKPGLFSDQIDQLADRFMAVAAALDAPARAIGDVAPVHVGSSRAL
jgi:NRPS condensation-like uncharacterized protein